MKARRATVLIFSVFLLFTISLKAADGNKQKDKPYRYKQCIENLKIGIFSDNDGVRSSAIYFAGKYKFTELKKTLMKQLDREKVSFIRIIIALSLYHIEDAEKQMLVKDVSENEAEKRMRKICNSLYNEFEKSINSDSLEIVISRQ